MRIVAGFAEGCTKPCRYLVQGVRNQAAAACPDRDMFKKGEYGFHHIGLLIHDVAAEVKRFEDAGYPSVCTLWGGDYVHYMDARHDMGCYVELHGDAPIIQDMFNGLKTDHEAWDGDVSGLIQEQG